MKNDSHIIDISPELNRRVQERRISDVSQRMKAERFDLLVAELKFKFDFWKEQWEKELSKPILAPAGARTVHREMVGYYEGNMHSAAMLLFTADIKVSCPCDSCRERTVPNSPTFKKGEHIHVSIETSDD